MGSTDTRAVTVQIGAVLLLGILVLMLTTYQATIVPDANRVTEFEHSQDVIDEMQTLQADYHNTISTGDDIESTVTLGTDYRSRLFAVTPPPVAGSLTTTAPDPIESDAVDIESICGADGSTRALEYEADYREYRDPPTITYGSSVLYLEFDEEILVQSEQSIVSGDQLSLMPLEGSISKRGTGRQSVRFRAGKIETVERTVEDGFNLTVPTGIPASQWETDPNLLADELVSEGGSVERVVNNETANGIDIQLQSGSYDIDCRVTAVDQEPSTGPAEDGSGDGGGGDNEDSSVGQGGESDFSETNSETISSPGGLWTGVADVNSTLLDNPRFSPVDAREGGIESDGGHRYFRLGLSISNESTEYVFLIGEEREGIEYELEPNQRDWQERDIGLYKYTEGENPDDVFRDEALTEAALNNWLDGGTLDLLNRLSYEDPAEVEDDLETVREFLDSSEASEVYITDMHGRTELTLDRRGSDNEAYFLSVDDGEENTETHAVQPDGGESYNALRFGLINPLPDEDIVIETVSMEITDGPSATRVENGEDTSGEYNDVVYFDGDDQAGAIEDGFDTGSTTTFDQQGDIGGDDAVEVYVNGFEDADGDPVDLEVGDEIEATVEYEVDGETFQQTLAFEIADRTEA
ncbi:MAG: hypothetical protein U9O06_00090 [Euryarchaeota archaeon]|nr:hypothetical protein [Euryarchaeota archaeon]